MNLKKNIMIYKIIAVFAIVFVFGLSSCTKSELSDVDVENSEQLIRKGANGSVLDIGDNGGDDDQDKDDKGDGIGDNGGDDDQDRDDRSSVTTPFGF